jgi:hypothetical protein
LTHSGPEVASAAVAPTPALLPDSPPTRCQPIAAHAQLCVFKH